MTAYNVPQDAPVGYHTLHGDSETGMEIVERILIKMNNIIRGSE